MKSSLTCLAAVGVFLLAGPIAAQTQQTEKVHRIGFIASTAAEEFVTMREKFVG